MHLTPNSVALLRAACVVLVLTAIVWGAMVVARTRAMQRHGVHPQDAAHTADLRGKLPRGSERIADNYNHLFEAPTAFYAVVLVLVTLGTASPIDVLAAWSYALLRIAHTIVQTTFNRVMLRFALFALSWIALIVLISDATASAFAVRFAP